MKALGQSLVATLIEQGTSMALPAEQAMAWTCHVRSTRTCVWSRVLFLAWPWCVIRRRLTVGIGVNLVCLLGNAVPYWRFTTATDYQSRASL